MVLSGVGDLVSNLTAIEDWRLAARERGEPVDGLAVTFARTAAEAVLHRTDGIESDGFLTALAEALVLSGMAMAAAGSSRPSSGADHEIMHAIDPLFPGTGQPRRAGRRRRALLGVPAGRTSGSPSRSTPACAGTSCPGCPADLGLSAEQFAEAVVLAPSTRPDRYTILEHLDLDAGRCRAPGRRLRRGLRRVTAPGWR